MARPAVLELLKVAQARVGAVPLRLTLLARPHLLPLFDLPGLRLLPLPDYRQLSDLPEIAQRLSRELLDGALLLSPSMRAQLEVTLAGVPIRVGYPDDVRGFLLTHPVQRPARLLAQAHVPFAQHGVLEALEAARTLLTAVGIQAELEIPTALEMEVPRMEQALVSEGLAAEGGGRGWVGLHPRSNGGVTRTWPLERWVGLARALLDAGLGVVVHGGPAVDEELEQAFLPLMGRACSGSGRSELLFLAGQASLKLMTLAAYAQREVAFVVNDTGPMHLAAAVGARVVAIVGSTDPRLTGPYSGQVTILRVPELTCSGCYRRVCPHALECLTGISVQDVLAVVLALAQNPA